MQWFLTGRLQICSYSHYGQKGKTLNVNYIMKLIIQSSIVMTTNKPIKREEKRLIKLYSIFLQINWCMDNNNMMFGPVFVS